MPLGSLVFIILGLVFGLHALVEIAGELEIVILVFCADLDSPIFLPWGVDEMDIGEIVLLGEIKAGWITIFYSKA